MKSLLNNGMVEVGDFTVPMYIYMFLHEENFKIFYVPYKELGLYGCLVFVQRKGRGQRHLVFDLAPKYLHASNARSVAEFSLEEIVNAEKKFDIQD